MAAMKRLLPDFSHYLVTTRDEYMQMALMIPYLSFEGLNL
jgi:hypothetical protein